MPEAPLEPKDGGLVPAGEGWFVVNARDARWFDGNELGGRYTSFEGPDARFQELGFGIGILRPGEASAMYHGEEAEENFLVLAGECLLLIEGEERLLRAWDFVHCPRWAEHIFVGAGNGPCVVAAVGKTTEGTRDPVPGERARAQAPRRRRGRDDGSAGGVQGLFGARADLLSARVPVRLS